MMYLSKQRGVVTKDIALAAQVVRQGGVIAYPTEAVFGLGCDPNNTTAVQRLLAIKQRPAHKGLILLANNLGQLHPFLAPLSSELNQTVQATWPGAVTWILPCQSHISPLVRGEHNSLAVRVTAHEPCRQLCQKLGSPIISSSANVSGKEPAMSVEEVQGQLGLQVDLILDAPLGGNKNPSEIRDGRTGDILRAG